MKGGVLTIISTAVIATSQVPELANIDSKTRSTEISLKHVITQGQMEVVGSEGWLVPPDCV